MAVLRLVYSISFLRMAGIAIHDYRGYLIFWMKLANIAPCIFAAIGQGHSCLLVSFINLLLRQRESKLMVRYCQAT